MKSIKDTLKQGLKVMAGPPQEEKNEETEAPITEFIEKVFTTRNLVHFSHWATGSYASHQALGELYEEIVEAVDGMVEKYIGEFSKLSGLETECAKLDGDIIARIQSDADWLKANRKRVANGSTTIENQVDEVLGVYFQALYKLKNLH